MPANLSFVDLGAIKGRARMRKMAPTIKKSLFGERSIKGALINIKPIQEPLDWVNIKLTPDRTSNGIRRLVLWPKALSRKRARDNDMIIIRYPPKVLGSPDSPSKGALTLSPEGT